MLKTSKDGVNLTLRFFKCAAVIDHVVDEWDLLLVRNLRGETRTGILFQGFEFFRIERSSGGETLQKALDLQIIRGGDENDAIEAFVPFGDAAGMAGFKDQRRFDHGNRFRVAAENVVRPCFLRSYDGGMNDAIQFIEAALAKSEVGKLRTIERAVFAEDFRSEVVDDLPIDGLAGLHEPTAYVICRNRVHSVRGKEPGDGTFAAAQSACESYAQH